MAVNHLLTYESVFCYLGLLHRFDQRKRNKLYNRSEVFKKNWHLSLQKNNFDSSVSAGFFICYFQDIYIFVNNKKKVNSLVISAITKLNQYKKYDWVNGASSNQY